MVSGHKFPATSENTKLRSLPKQKRVILVFWAVSGCAQSPSLKNLTPDGQESSRTSALVSDSQNTQTDIETDFSSFKDPQVNCPKSPMSAPLWEIGLLRSSDQLEVNAATLHRSGGVLLGGQTDSSAWLGLLASSGQIARARRFPTAGSPVSAVHRATQCQSGQIALAGLHSPLANSSGYGFCSVHAVDGSVQRNWDVWSLNMQWSLPISTLRCLERNRYIVAGTAFAKRNAGQSGFMALVDAQLSPIWSFQTTENSQKWSFRTVQSTVSSKTGDIYVTGEIWANAPEIQRAAIAKITSSGEILWLRELTPEDSTPEIARPVSAAHRVALVPNESMLWIVGTRGNEGSRQRGVLWAVNPISGDVIRERDIKFPEAVERNLDSAAFVGLIADKRSITYAWTGQSSIGEFTSGEYSEVVRLSHEGEPLWRASYNPVAGPGEFSNVRVSEILDDGKSGLYVLGNRKKQELELPEYERHDFAYAARFCP